MSIIKEFRTKKGLSQSQLAEKLGVSIRAVQSWEQGWRNTPKSIQKLIELI